MLYTEFTAGNKDYKLRLNTRNLVSLEQKLGCNPLSIFGDSGETIPTVSTMVTILHASLQQYQHGIDLNAAYGIFDDWIEDGNNMIKFVEVILDIYRTSGIIPKEVETDETEKN
jgi:hypothetical protein